MVITGHPSAEVPIRTPGFSFWTTGSVELQRNALANLEELKSTVDVYADSLNMDEVPRPSRHVRASRGTGMSTQER